jgi:hypothetical protein
MTQSSFMKPLQISHNVIAQRLQDETILINMDTDRSFVLNRTSSRFWELCEQGLSVDQIQVQMLTEFDVTEAQLHQEIDRIIAMLQSEGLITL